MRFLRSVLACALVCGCTTPFSAAVNDYDFSHPQSRAAIVLSDPQVYARETLINDRAAEIAYLNTLLESSVTLQFTPQLRRDLATLSGFMAQLSLNADSVAGDSIERRGAIADEQQRIRLLEAEAALTRAEADLLEERNRLAALQRGEPPSTLAIADNDIEAETPDDGDNGDDAELSDVRDLLQAATDIRSLMNDLRNRGEVRETGVEASHQETFRDRQTYREEVRAALADVNLDDGHDIDGNALYRLQFRATVMPGAERSQFAAARVTFSPPVLSDRDAAELYMSWLTYLNQQLNVPERSTGQYRPGAHLRAAGAYSGLFDVIELTFEGPPLQLAIPSEFGDYLLRVLRCSKSKQGPTIEQDGRIAPQRVQLEDLCAYSGITAFNLSAFHEKLPRAQGTERTCPTARQLDNIAANLRSLDEGQRAPLLTLAVLVSASQADVTRTHDTELYRGLVEQLRRNAADAAYASTTNQSRIRDILLETFDADACTDEIVRERYASTLRSLAAPYTSLHTEYPEHLIGADLLGRFRALLEPSSRPATMLAFFARPIDQSQRISSIQGAANAVDLALAIRQQMDGSGISGALGANYVRQAVGRIETLERAPLVVGFNDRILIEESCRDVVIPCTEERHAIAHRTRPQAGWIFGPTLQPARGANRLEARQNILNHAVSTDISAPGWWPWIEAKLETAWIGNWAGHGDVFEEPRDVAVRTFHIPLSQNSADMDSLTRHLAGLGAPLTAPHIYVVSPSTVHVCPTGSNIRLQVSGRNLWQGAEAFLNGVQASRVRVLPDMGGLDLTFSLRDMQASTGAAELVVWTRDHRETTSVMLQRAESDSPFCDRRGSEAALNIQQNWLAPGAQFSARLGDPSLLDGRHQARLEVRRYVDSAGAAGPWITIGHDGAGGALAVTETGVIAMTLPSPLPGNLEDGAQVEVSLAVRPRPDAADTRAISASRAAIYTAIDQASIETAAPIITETSDTNTLIVQMPKHPALRYRGFDVSRMTLRGELTLNGQLYVFEGGRWSARQPSSDAAGRPRFSTSVSLVAGDRSRLIADLPAAGASASFALMLGAERIASSSITIRK